MYQKRDGLSLYKAVSRITMYSNLILIVQSAVGEDPGEAPDYTLWPVAGILLNEFYLLKTTFWLLTVLSV